MSLPEYSADSVFGHYVHKKGDSKWEPLVDQSRELFRAVVADDHLRVEEEVKADPSKAKAVFILLYWGGNGGDAQNGEAAKTNVTVKQRSLLMLAAYHGCLRVVSTLVMNGAMPGQLSADGLNAYQMAIAGEHPCAAAVVAYLREAEGLSQVQNGDQDCKNQNSEGQNCSALKKAEGNGSNGSDDTGIGSELTKPEYSTDHFRMLCFKVLRCMKRSSHDWRCCPFAHTTENARRRDPMDHRYCSISCPDYKRGFCIRGDNCPYAHGIYESWLHPSRYRTQLCKDGNICRRPVCFFAHTVEELRAPTQNWVPTTEDLKDATESVVLPIASKGVETENDRLAKKIKQKTKKSALSALTEEHNKLQGQAEDNGSRVFAPRMSNAFARRHGLNPKDDPSLVLHKMSSTGLQMACSPEAPSGLVKTESDDLTSVASMSEEVLPWAIQPQSSSILLGASRSVPSSIHVPVKHNSQVVYPASGSSHPGIPIASTTRIPTGPMQMPSSLPNALHSAQLSFGGLSLNSSPSNILSSSILAPELQEEVLMDGRITSQNAASPYGNGSGISLLREFSGQIGSYSDASSQWFSLDDQNPVNTFPGAGGFWLPQYY